MSDTTQPRDTAGRFGETVGSEPVVDLASLNLWSDTGTFEFPPAFKDVPHLAKFWSDVEIPDEALLATRTAFETRAETEYLIEREMFRQEDLRGFVTRLDEWAAQRRESYRGVRALGIAPSTVAPLVRMTKMVSSARALGPDAEATVRDVKVTLPGTDGASRTVGFFVDYYRSLDLEKDMVDKQRANAVTNIIDKERGIIAAANQR